ncbi:MAG: tetratricopeptide repeat protein, partial [Myxococcota bacterium]
MFATLLPTALVFLSVFPTDGTRWHGFGDRALLHAREAFTDGEDEQARNLLEIALDALPAGGEMAAQARFLAARTALNLNEPHQALGYLKDLENSFPEVRDYILFYRAAAHRAAGEWPISLKLWRQLVAKYPYSPLAPESRFSIADSLRAMGRVRDAAENYDLAIERHSKHDRVGIARFVRARLAEQLRDWELAAESFRAIAIDAPLDFYAPQAMRRLEDLATRRRVPPLSFYERMRRIDRYLSARAVDPAHRELQELLDDVRGKAQQMAWDERVARVAYRSDDFETALAGFQNLAERSSGPQRARYLRWASRSLAALGRFDEAVNIYEKLARDHRTQPDGRVYLYKAAWLAYNGGDHERSRTLFTEYAERFGETRDVDDADWFIAWNAYRLGDDNAALRKLRGLRRRYPSSKLVQRTHYWEARILHRQGRLDEAARAYGVAIDKEPSNYYAIYSTERLKELVAQAEPEAAPQAALERLARPRFAALGAVASKPPPATIGTPNTKRARATPLTPEGSEVFDWSRPTGKRAIRLMTLGFVGAATDLVRRLEAKSGHDDAAVHFARARLLYTLGDYHAAFRIAASRLRNASPKKAEAVSEMLYPFAHGELVERAEVEWKLSPLLLLSVIRQESAFDDRARSWASARGLMQIIPPTAARIAEALEVANIARLAIDVALRPTNKGRISGTMRLRGKIEQACVI